jgi:LacI family transcriptional regulator
MQPRVSLRDIASVAGVSVTTVSLALRNSPEISLKRRRELKALAKKMGYRPDPALAALAEYKLGRRKPEYRENLAFLYQTVRDESFDEWKDWPLRRKMIDGITQRAEELGYQLEIHNLGTKPDRQKHVARMLRERGVRAVLMHANIQPPEEAAVHLTPFAVVNILQYCAEPCFHSIRSNDYEAMQLALAHIYAAGHRHPLYVLPNASEGLYGPEKLGAFTWSTYSYPQMSPRWMSDAVFKKKAADILSGRTPIDILLIHNHRLLESLMATSGLHREDIIPVCLMFASPEIPSYSGINIQPFQLGLKTVELADSLLRHNDIGPTDHPTTVLVQPRWLDNKVETTLKTAKKRLAPKRSARR